MTRRSLLATSVVLTAPRLLAQSRRPLFMISVDGLDHRYLRDCDRLGLRIPHLRRLMAEGEWADGVVGVFPTVTWPSHTSLITGVAPHRHGILGNRRPSSAGGDYYWNVDLLQAPTLWHATRKAGLRSAAITWPVTVDAQIDLNLPEYFRRRNGGAMDLDSIEAKATPGLITKISRRYPSFAQEWMNDRTRALAAAYLLDNERPDLVLLHFVDLDAEAHARGPFTREAHAVLEYTDELIGAMLAVMPRNYVVALVSDHGFERVDRIVNLKALLAREKIPGEVFPGGGLVSTPDVAVADFLRRSSADSELGVGREIPAEELRRFSPQLKSSVAAFEPAPHVMFGGGVEQLYSEPHEKGNHGFWPARSDYRSVFVLWGNGVKAARLPELSMLDIAPRAASILGIPFQPATG